MAAKKALRELSTHCFGTAESELGLGCIDRIYVDSTGLLEELREMPHGSPRLLVGHKGSGKTLILNELKRQLEKDGIYALYVTPSDILCGMSPSGEEPAVLKRFYFNALVTGVAAQLGKDLPGFVSGSDVVLLKASLEKGVREFDNIEKTLSFLATLRYVLGKDNRSAHQVQTVCLPDASISAITCAVDNKLSQKDGKPFYLFIDEPDDVGTEDLAAARVWGLLNACRDFAQRLKNVRCVVSLRTEMWYLLTRSSSGRKNIDHFKPLVVSLDPLEKEIRMIVERRLHYVADRLNLLGGLNECYGVFFEGESTRLPPPARDEQRSWEDYLIKTSRERPRDAIQLIKMLADHALKDGRTKISSQDVLSCAAKFSEERLTYLVKEYENDFPDAFYVYKNFAQHNFALPAEDVREILEQAIGFGHVQLRGEILSRAREEDVFSLWKMLHETGFLNPLVADDRRARDFRHINFCDDEDLVSISNYSEMCLYTWEVHPAYRSYLYTLQENEIHRQAIMKERQKFRKNVNYFDHSNHCKKRRNR